MLVWISAVSCKEMAENQAFSQSSIFFRLLEDGDCHSQSADIEYPHVLDIPVPKLLVIRVSWPPLRIPKTLILPLMTNLVKAKLFER